MGLFRRKKSEDKKEEKKQVEKSAKVSDDKKKKSALNDQQLEKNKKIKKDDIKKDHGQAYKNLIRPVITEKVSFLGMYNQYVFEVSPRANKIEIKKAIEKLYGVKPVKINIINLRGKNVRYGRQFGNLKNWKKAIVTLKSGDKINVYEGV